MPPGLDRGLLPNRDMVFEFTLVPSTVEKDKMAASDIVLVYDYGYRRPVMPSVVNSEVRPPVYDREPSADRPSPFLIEKYTPATQPESRPPAGN
jgi:hypothetical protein